MRTETGDTQRTHPGGPVTAWDAAPAAYRHWCRGVAHGVGVADLLGGAEVLSRAGGLDGGLLHRALVHRAQAGFTSEYDWSGYGPQVDSWWSLVPVILRYARFPLFCLAWLAAGIVWVAVR